jgi:hypothetical protein
MTASNEHADDCLMRRYLALPDEAREWFPVELGGRPDLCTCGGNPGSNALRPEVQDVVEELRERVEAVEARQGPGPGLAGFDLRAAGGKRTVVYLAPDVLEHLAAMQRAAEAAGHRLDRSAIVNQLVRRHRDSAGA